MPAKKRGLYLPPRGCSCHINIIEARYSSKNNFSIAAKLLNSICLTAPGKSRWPRINWGRPKTFRMPSFGSRSRPAADSPLPILWSLRPSKRCKPGGRATNNAVDERSDGLKQLVPGRLWYQNYTTIPHCRQYSTTKPCLIVFGSKVGSCIYDTRNGFKHSTTHWSTPNMSNSHVRSNGSNSFDGRRPSATSSCLEPG